MLTMPGRRPAGPAITAAAVLVLAAGCWAVAAWLMHGMDMGLATPAGSFGFFAAAWVTMMAAMMLPGAAPAIARQPGRRGTPLAALTFTAAYLTVWAAAGLVAYVLDRPHGPLAAGVVALAAAGYELTPAKRHFRRRGQAATSSGLGFGLCCTGSSAGLMAVLVALDPMSLFWMAVVALIACGQKLLPARAAVDVPVALALAGLGVLIIIAPAHVPGLVPAPM
jgi:predicted metal-binding membrane protein